jgi:hypothetical protein
LTQHRHRSASFEEMLKTAQHQYHDDFWWFELNILSNICLGAEIQYDYSTAFHEQSNKILGCRTRLPPECSNFLARSPKSSSWLDYYKQRDE